MAIRKLLSALLCAALLLLLPACQSSEPADTKQPVATDNTINGVQLEDYTLVYSDIELDFNRTAAEYVSSEIAAVSGVTLPVKLDTETEETDCEILVGPTNRAASASAAETELGDYEFLIRAYDKKIVLYGNEYMVAGAAYQFVHKNFTQQFSEVTVPAEGLIAAPEFTAPKNLIMVIGDGMGFNSLALGEYFYEHNPLGKAFSASTLPQFCVANRLPNKGKSYTHSADHDVTDSAAGGTALATGYKTNNKIVGQLPDGTVVKNLCELALEKGMAAAVLTTDTASGATPAAFSAHVKGRSQDSKILAQQAESKIDVITADIPDTPEIQIREALAKITTDKGFFMMYEEAHIDKSAHQQNEKTLYASYARLNRALRVFNEFMMYHPDTLLVLTADHETGGIQWDEEAQEYLCTIGEHTGINVPLFAVGVGTEIFDGKTYDNTFVAKFFARLMGDENFGDSTIPETTDKDGLDTRETTAETTIEDDAEEAA